MLYPPSDFVAQTIPAEGGRGCGQEHRRPVGPDGQPVHPWALQCEPCEAWLRANDDRWSPTIAEIKLTHDEAREREQLAVAAEREAADRLRGARAHLRKVTRAEERARCDQAGPEKLTEALMRRRAAADITEEVRLAAERAVRAREAAERARDQHLARLAVLEDEAVAAERAAQNPPEKVPPSVWTCLLANPLHLLMQPDLGAEGRTLVAAQVANLAKLAGVSAELRAEGRAAAEAEAADRTRRPVSVQPLSDGGVAAIPNPSHPGTPRQAGTPGGWT